MPTNVKKEIHKVERLGCLLSMVAEAKSRLDATRNNTAYYGLYSNSQEYFKDVARKMAVVVRLRNAYTREIARLSNIPLSAIV